MQKLQCKEEYQNCTIRVHRQLVFRDEKLIISKVIDSFCNHSQHLQFKVNNV
ncbi:hypothetical protein BgiMline_002970, partial [Biomphalaria glabrata]